MGCEARVGMPGALQDTFLTECRRQGTSIVVFLVNGFQLRGVLKAFDSFTILLEYDDRTHLVYKHAISTISPAAPVAIASHYEAAPGAP